MAIDMKNYFLGIQFPFMLAYVCDLRHCHQSSTQAIFARLQATPRREAPSIQLNALLEAVFRQSLHFHPSHRPHKLHLHPVLAHRLRMQHQHPALFSREPLDSDLAWPHTYPNWSLLTKLWGK